MRRLASIGYCVLLPLSMAGCAVALRPANMTSRQTLQIQAPGPERYGVRVNDTQSCQVATDGLVSFEVPPLPSGCAVYLFGFVKVSDRRSEDVPAIQVLREGQVVRRLSLNQISRLPSGSGESRVLALK
jgi:hypothetical protein